MPKHPRHNEILAERVESFRRAKARLYKRAIWAERIDDVLAPIAEKTGLCPVGSTSKERNHWSKLLAQMFYVECSCCLTYRMFFVGVTFGLTMGLGLSYVVSVI